MQLGIRLATCRRVRSWLNTCKVEFQIQSWKKRFQTPPNLSSMSNMTHEIERLYTILEYNEFVIQKANDELGHQPGAPLRIKLFSDLLIDRRIKLAGHILRCEDNDPLRRVSYEPNSAETFNVGKRRVGGPRQQWTQYANKYAWENVLRKGRYENGANQNQELLISARNRHFEIAFACPRFHSCASTGMKPWLRKKVLEYTV